MTSDSPCLTIPRLPGQPPAQPLQLFRTAACMSLPPVQPHFELVRHLRQDFLSRTATLLTASLKHPSGLYQNLNTSICQRRNR